LRVEGKDQADARLVLETLPVIYVLQV